MSKPHLSASSKGALIQFSAESAMANRVKSLGKCKSELCELGQKSSLWHQNVCYT